ncbi:unnamed protein product [Mesocestoides corti]|uniref:Uncharacterized protein n=1 Tax=Mesocestoides corti TaxID=53468 RepID=A0A0R3U7Z7_MESCO|nr:unnamed protein product [Mesocestoides corti]
MSSGWTECTVVNPEWFDLGRRRRRWMARAVVMNVAARARPLNQVARARHGAAAAAGATASLEIKVRRSADTSQSSLPGSASATGDNSFDEGDPSNGRIALVITHTHTHTKCKISDMIKGLLPVFSGCGFVDRPPIHARSALWVFLPG